MYSQSTTIFQEFVAHDVVVTTKEEIHVYGHSIFIANCIAFTTLAEYEYQFISNVAQVVQVTILITLYGMNILFFVRFLMLSMSCFELTYLV